MRATLATLLFILIIALLLPPAADAQSGGESSLKKSGKTTETKSQQKKTQQPIAEPAPEAADQQEDTETVKVETNLVTIPVIVSDRGDKYVADLRQDEFSIYEDGVQQKVAYFDTVTAPFHVVLMLDTSASTQDKLNQIQRAAIEFTEQLQPADRVKVISFDDQIRELSDFSSDRAVLQWAIKSTRPGLGTKLYDAVNLAINKLQSVKGRKAIVIFTDGVDLYSDRATYEQNRKALQESGIIVYPIRYDTREDVERLVRQQQRSGGQTVDLATILSGGSGTARGTTPTFPGESKGPISVPIITGRSSTSPTGVRLPGGITITEENTNEDSRDNRNSRTPGTSDRNARYPDRRPGGVDSISTQLDMLYSTGEAYLNDLANETGGSLYRADTLFYLPDAFAKIAAELRTQYSVGYYPTQSTRDGKYHKISVKVSRKDISVRARPGYRAGSTGK
ncbi:MAG TPA: VWA domain-containing protein [Pyrinomonadaceae bacterium]|jgi:VWFA-related protein